MLLWWLRVWWDDLTQALRPHVVVPGVVAVAVAAVFVIATAATSVSGRSDVIDPPITDTPVSDADFAFLDTLDTGKPRRWDPCKPIMVVVDSDHLTPQFASVVSDVFTQLSTLTGLRFVMDGTAAAAPSQPHQVIFVTLLNEREWAAEDLPSQAIGVARGYRTSRYLDNSWIGLRLDRLVGWELRTTLRHEAGHALGLAHVSRVQNLMAPVMSSAVRDYGPGDRRGLAKVGVQPGDSC